METPQGMVSVSGIIFRLVLNMRLYLNKKQMKLNFGLKQTPRIEELVQEIKSDVACTIGSELSKL